MLITQIPLAKTTAAWLVQDFTGRTTAILERMVAYQKVVEPPQVRAKFVV
jgi:hypothetical protein